MCSDAALQLPFPLGFLQQHQCAPAAPVDWEAAAKQYSACRAPHSQPQSQPEQLQQQQQQTEDYGGKRKRATKGFKEVPNETAEADEVAPPGELMPTSLLCFVSMYSNFCLFARIFPRLSVQKRLPVCLHPYFSVYMHSFCPFVYFFLIICTAALAYLHLYFSVTDRHQRLSPPVGCFTSFR